jgi:glycosyltransferase involved in cell wall biosynthesis
MHVLIALIKVDSQFAGSGITQAVADRCKALTERGHEVTIVASFDDAQPRPPCDGVSLVHVPLVRRAPQLIPGLNDALHGKAIGQAISRGRIQGRVDLVDVQEAGIARGVYSAARRAGWAVVHSIHLSALYGLRRFGAIRRHVLVSQNLWAAKHADRCVAVSECVRDAYLRAGIDGGRISVVYNAVRMPGEAPKRDARVQSETQIMWLGRMVEGKGVVEAVQTAECCTADPAGPSFLFVGGGHLEELVRAAAERNAKIRWAGIVRDPGELDRLRAQSDVFLATSHHETFGLAVAEAMAAAMPVVASDIAAHREVLGDAGVLYDSGDTEALKERIMRLASLPEERAALGNSARLRAEALFDRKREAEKLLAVYTAACAAHGGTRS